MFEKSCWLLFPLILGFEPMMNYKSRVFPFQISCSCAELSRSLLSILAIFNSNAWNQSIFIYVEKYIMRKINLFLTMSENKIWHVNLFLKKEKNKIWQVNLFLKKEKNKSIHSRIIRNKQWSIMRNFYKSWHDSDLRK